MMSDGAHLTSFGIEFQTEEEAKENERSPSVALLCAGLLRRGMVYELERVLRVCNCQSVQLSKYGEAELLIANVMHFNIGASAVVATTHGNFFDNIWFSSR